MMMSETFQTLSIPRFSWIITECRKAVPTSQGMRLAFSTGSHAQYPPQPSSLYAHAPPSRMPTPLKNQANSVQRRVEVIQSVSSLPLASAPMQKAKGTAKPT